MKPIKTILLVVILLTTVIGYANEKVIDLSLKGITILKFSNVKKGHQYKIIDDKGTILFTEKIKRNGTFVKRFDFTALNNGSYILELDKDFEIIITPFIIQSNNVVFLEKNEKVIFKPVVRTENNQLLISHMSLDEQPLKIELYYNGERIFKDQLVGDKILNKIYKLSSQEKGSYYLSMTSGGRSFIKSFELL
ncbi:hypothetical protein ES692_08195 [Psychroserpens burtonensis]|uniref:Uncharacterized protein n=1 Tax=Psychroserpens burtonensis TaxID=49278 RepID=A0A5C7B940_9FLAO|nr:hypothetical protein [Psychroserpens burtonensis]TXE17870.1 hypothetical protein ES692_08195 [Psychroserpens burtonensis]